MSGFRRQDWSDSRAAREPLHASVVHGAPVHPAALPLTPGPVRRSKWRWVGWGFMMIMIGAVIGLCIVGYLKFVDGPVEGTLPSIDDARKSTAPKPPRPNLLSGLAIEFQYPAEYDAVGQVKTDAQALEQYNIGSKTDSSRSITVHVRPLPSGKLEDDSSYRFRQLSASTYRPVQDTIAGEPIVIFIKQDQHEQTLFWPHDGKEVIVSLTSSNPKDDLTAIMTGIKSSLRWRR